MSFWPVGTRVRKTRTMEGDQHNDGTLGTIRGHELVCRATTEHPDVYAYYVEWDVSKGRYFYVGESRLKRSTYKRSK